MAQERGLPRGYRSMRWCSFGLSLGVIEVAQERGLPLGWMDLVFCSRINTRVAEGERSSYCEI